MQSKRNGGKAPTEVNLTATEPQPDPADERRARLRIHLRGMEFEGDTLPVGVVAVVGLVLMAFVAAGTATMAHQFTGTAVIWAISSGCVMAIAIAIATVVLVRMLRDPGRAKERRNKRASSTTPKNRGKSGAGTGGRSR